MKTFALIPVFLQVVSATVSTPLENQQILQGNVEITEADIKHLLAVHNGDPVEVMRLVDPVHAALLDEPRLLEVLGLEPTWMAESNKLRFMRHGLSFMDLTGHENLFMSTVSSSKDIGVCLFLIVVFTTGAGLINGHVAAEWPDLRHQERVNKVIKSLKVEEMVHNLGNLTGFYNRCYRSEYGAQSSRWIYNKVLEVGL